MNLTASTAILLLMIAVVMVMIGITGKILPPALTGVGFVFIAFVFLQDKKK